MNSQEDDQILLETIEQIQRAIETAGDKIAGKAQASVDRSLSIFDKAKDNIAWVLGLPAAFAGSFGFLWDSSGDEAALTYQVAQLEEAVAELKAEGDLLGGGTKNFSLDMSQAPGGSITVVLVAGAFAVLLGTLVWYQSRRRRRR